MTEISLEEQIKAWDFENNGVAPEESTLAARLEILTYRALAEGEPVSAERLAALAGVPVALAEALFKQGRERGGEWDEAGRLLGNVLTLIPTPHRFRVNGKELYTWCSLDAMHLPGLLNQTAEVKSADPITGQQIYLTIPPDGVPTYRPTETMLSIALSGGDRSGPQSSLCRQMQFFASPESAAVWASDHPNAAIMTVEEVHQLVRAQVHAPLERVLRQLGSVGRRDKEIPRSNTHDC